MAKGSSAPECSANGAPRRGEWGLGCWNFSCHPRTSGGLWAIRFTTTSLGIIPSKAGILRQHAIQAQKKPQETCGARYFRSLKNLYPKLSRVKIWSGEFGQHVCIWIKVAPHKYIFKDESLIYFLLLIIFPLHHKQKQNKIVSPSSAYRATTYQSDILPKLRMRPYPIPF